MHGQPHIKYNNRLCPTSYKSPLQRHSSRASWACKLTKYHISSGNMRQPRCGHPCSTAPCKTVVTKVDMPTGEHSNQQPPPNPCQPRRLKVRSVTSCANSVDQERDGMNVEDQKASRWCKYSCDADADICTLGKKQAASPRRVLNRRVLLLCV